MKKIIIAAVAVAVFAAAAMAQCKNHGKMENHNLLKMSGADISAVNTATGVQITVSSTDPETAKKIQEIAASHIKDGKWECPDMAMKAKGCKNSKHEGCPRAGKCAKAKQAAEIQK